MVLTFDLHDSRDCLDDLRETVADFKKDRLNPRIAGYGAVVAWSICDWVFLERGPQLGYKNLTSLQIDAREKCPGLGYLQDLANSLKHKTITMYKPALDEAFERKGAFASGFSREFDTSGLMLATQDERELWYEHVIEEVLSFWEEYLEGIGL